MEVIDFFKHLFETSDWPPRWFCGNWTSFHGWLYIFSDAVIWLAYFIIPVILLWFIQKRPEVPFMPIFWLFGAFIILCGTTHLLDAVIFWWPAYRLSALIRFFTAIVSMFTVFALIRDLPKMLQVDFRKIESVKNNQKQKEASLQVEIDERDKKIEVLENEIQELKSKNG